MENKAQKLASRIFIFSALGLGIAICIGLYFSNFSLSIDSKGFNKQGLYRVKEKLPAHNYNSYYEDTWTGQKYASGNNFEVFEMEQINANGYAFQVKFSGVNFNVNDSIYLYYRDSYSYSRGDSTFIGAYADSAILINEARKRHLCE